MSRGRIAALRRTYHRRICEGVMRVNSPGIPNNADRGSPLSVQIRKGILEKIAISVSNRGLSGQTAGRQSGQSIKSFLEAVLVFFTICIFGNKGDC